MLPFKEMVISMVIISFKILKEIFKNLEMFTKILKNEPKTKKFTLDSRFYHLNQLSEGSGPL